MDDTIVPAVCRFPQKEISEIQSNTITTISILIINPNPEICGNFTETQAKFHKIMN